MAELFVPQTRREYWGANWDLQSRTADYHESVDRVVEGGFVSRRYRHPWSDAPRHNRPRAFIRVFTGHGASCVDAHAFDRVQDMFYHFDRVRASPPTPLRRLIILEDIDPRFAELLGVELGVPPEFFLAHCDEQAHLSLVDAMYSKHGRSTYWRVPVPQERIVPRGSVLGEGDFYVAVGAMDRPVAALHRKRATVEFRSLVSYWGQKDANGGWTAILLVDPREASLRAKAVDDVTGATYSQKRVFLRDVNGTRPSSSLQLRMDTGFSEANTPHRRCIYRTLTEAYNANASDMKENNDPFAITIIARNLIYSMWDELTYQYALDFQHALDAGDDNNFAPTTALEKMKNHQKLDESEYNEITAKGRDIAKLRRLLMEMRQSFLAPNAEHQRPSTSATFSVDDALDDGRLEARRWRVLEERIEDVDRTLKIYLDDWAQRADMRGYFASHRRAQKVAELTKLATVTVPAAVVSGICFVGDQASKEWKKAGGKLAKRFRRHKCQQCTCTCHATHSDMASHSDKMAEY